MSGTVQLGTMKSEDGKDYKACAKWEIVNGNLRIRVMERATGKRFDDSVLGKRKSLDAIKLMKGWKDYLAQGDRLLEARVQGQVGAYVP
ncbi:hypothetical protein IFR05_014106 [Cadophora sp. M221]|nr:hypothetical protein IFR05_014106 [Cadophora sp. M221]